MGSFFTKPENLPLENGEAEEAEGLKETDKRDGRSYSEVVQGGRETNSMSELEKSVRWKFVQTPKNEFDRRQCRRIRRA